MESGLNPQRIRYSMPSMSPHVMLNGMDPRCSGAGVHFGSVPNMRQFQNISMATFPFLPYP